MLRNSLPCLVLAVCVSSASAQAPKPIKLWLTPAKPPTPSLKYQLLPDARVTLAGNAAPIYRQANELLQKIWANEKKWQQVGPWLDMPLDKLPKEEMRKVLAEYDTIYELLDKAARHDHCDWGLFQHIREKGRVFRLEKGVSDPLTDIQSMVVCDSLLRLRMRLELASGQPDKGLVALRTGFALARHTGETETGHTFATGVRIAGTITECLDEWVGYRDAPNLYFALSDLPAPLVSSRKAIEGERVMTCGTFPGLSESAFNLAAGAMTPKQAEDCVKALQRYPSEEMKYNYSDRKKLTQAILEKHEIAKKALITSGRPPEKVEAMPHVQIALLHSLLEYDMLLDQSILWDNLPYWEMTAQWKDLAKMNREERQTDPNAPAIALTQLFFGDAKEIAFDRARLDRKIALLRVIEAIRFHAAIHDGKLPPTLSAIKEVPIPFDPMTGKAFEYQLDGDVAKLRAPPPAGQKPNVSNSVVYELRIRK